MAVQLSAASSHHRSWAAMDDIYTKSKHRIDRILLQVNIVWIVLMILCFAQIGMVALDWIHFTNFGNPPYTFWLWISGAVIMTLAARFVRKYARNVLLDLEKSQKEKSENPEGKTKENPGR